MGSQHTAYDGEYTSGRATNDGAMHQRRAASGGMMSSGRAPRVAKPNPHSLAAVHAITAQVCQCSIAHQCQPATSPCAHNSEVGIKLPVLKHIFANCAGDSRHIVTFHSRTVRNGSREILRGVSRRDESERYLEKYLERRHGTRTRGYISRKK
jgi:hypothetical protein